MKKLTEQEKGLLTDLLIAATEAVDSLESANPERRAELKSLLIKLEGSDVFVNHEEEINHEEEPLVPEYEELISTLKERFLNGEAHYSIYRDTETWMKVEKALRADPESLEKLRRLENSFGAPNLFEESVIDYVFVDLAAESPRTNPHYYDASNEAIAMGVDFIPLELYRRMLAFGTFDRHTKTHLDSTDHMTYLCGDHRGLHRRKEVIDPAQQMGEIKYGWRGMVKVPKTKS
ncbi:MAG: DUF4256 domain-containing protein [Candidatus Gracilibacteria bacterium]|nr:DUF4256 domain-containing protein [Candidatus Gracilibacteria bacterium]